MNSTFPNAVLLKLLEVVEWLTFYWSMHGPVYTIKEFVKLRIKSTYADMLKLALFNTEINHYYKLTSQCPVTGFTEIVSHLSIFKKSCIVFADRYWPGGPAMKSTAKALMLNWIVWLNWIAWNRNVFDN